MSSFRIRLYLGFALAIILCAISGTTSYMILEKQQKQRQWLRQARWVLDSTLSIQNQLTEMEDYRSEFRATNQRQFLEPYYARVKSIQPTVAKLRTLVAGDAEMKVLEDSLEVHLANLFDFWMRNGDDATGYTKESIIKEADEEKIKSDSLRQLLAILQKNESHILNKGREEYEQLIHFGTISTIWDSIIAEVIILVLIYIIIVEFNSRRKIQEQLSESVDKLENKTQSLQKSESDLKNAMEELGTINKQLEKFTYTVAHDIKSPLYGIISALALAKEEDGVADAPRVHKFLDLSSSAALHLSKMVDFLLEYAKTGLMHQEPEAVDTKEMIAQLVVLLFPPENITIHLPDEMPVFNTWKLKIMQVFQNLLSNAIKYNDKEKGRIEVGYADRGDFYEFYVKDNGHGISNDFKDKIFNLARTANGKAKMDSSTGFGLGIAKFIVEEQGGRIWFDSVEGEGATFYFEWRK